MNVNVIHERILFRTDGSNNHRRRLFDVENVPVVLRWANLNGEFQLRVYLGTNSKCSFSTLEDSYPYVEVGHVGSCSGEPDPIILSGTGALVLSDPGKYVLAPVSGAEPTEGIVVVQPVDADRASLLLSSRGVSLMSCNSCPDQPTVGLVTAWN